MLEKVIAEALIKQPERRTPRIFRRGVATRQPQRSQMRQPPECR